MQFWLQTLGFPFTKGRAQASGPRSPHIAGGSGPFAEPLLPPSGERGEGAFARLAVAKRRRRGPV